ncbi:MAG: YjfK family protein [Motiliproteus sp.]
MLNFFKSKKPDVEPKEKRCPEILGLRLGGAVELNELRLRLISDQLITDSIAKMQMIQAVGMVNLDIAHTILRYYTDDDAFFQIVLEGGLTEEFITDVKLFHYYETKGIANNAEWDQLIAEGISKPTFECSGKSFTRVWESVGANPPVAMTEKTEVPQEPLTETDQFVMLYELPLDDSLYEFLLVSGEEKIVDNQYDRCIVISTGINLSQADFEVVA